MHDVHFIVLQYSYYDYLNYFFMHRRDLNLCANYNSSDQSCVHLFRWVLSPIYLFMEPRLLSDMALNYLPGTAPMIQQIHLAIPEICDNATTFVDKEKRKWDRGTLLLNKLTTFVSSYKLDYYTSNVTVVI